MARINVHYEQYQFESFKHFTHEVYKFFPLAAYSSEALNPSPLSDHHPIRIKGTDKDPHLTAKAANSNRDSGNSSTNTPNLESKHEPFNLNGSCNSHVLTARDMEMVTYALPSTLTHGGKLICL